LFEMCRTFWERAGRSHPLCTQRPSALSEDRSDKYREEHTRAFASYTPTRERPAIERNDSAASKPGQSKTPDKNHLCRTPVANHYTASDDRSFLSAELSVERRSALARPADGGRRLSASGKQVEQSLTRVSVGRTTARGELFAASPASPTPSNSCILNPGGPHAHS